MITERAAGYITIILEDNDFKTIDWKPFLAEVKKIPTAEYDGVLKLWTIKDNDGNLERASKIIKKYTQDKNQMELF